MRVLITGGAGFIGCNLADWTLERGRTLTILDDLSRPGSLLNLAWLRERHGNRFEFIQADVRDPGAVTRACRKMDVIFHLASQTAVTTSVSDPRTDFMVNALGTINVLEAARTGDDPVVVFASTNKVYGQLAHLPLEKTATRYVLRGPKGGVDETEPLDLCSPYGCSKGAADQYVRDYFRTYGVRTIVLRQSCIYGPRQLGVEDQGWVSWFCVAAVLNKPVTIYGDGRQVRDLLHVRDLCHAYEAAVSRIDVSAGHVYNIGGGHENSVSIWLEFGRILEEVLGRTIEVSYGQPRTGDQRLFICDYTRALTDLDWLPRIGVREGIRELVSWVQGNRIMFEELFGR